MTSGTIKTARARRRALERAGAELAAARARVALLRRTIAAKSKPGDRLPLIGPRWKWAQKIVDHHRARLLAHPDVVGFGLGFRYANGHRTDEPVLTVYVKQKLGESTLKKTRGRLLRPLKLDKRVLPIDVIPAGAGLHRQLSPGGSVGVGMGSTATLGTLGCFALNANGDITAITAMHVTDEEERPPGQAIDISSPSPRLQPGAPAIGQVTRGTMTGVDAARIDLDSKQSVQWSPDEFDIVGWRRVHWPGDDLTRVRLVGARSGFIVGHIRNANVALPQYDLDDAIIVSMPTVKGDSGAAIVDDAGLVLGFLVGRGDDMPDQLRIFTPASLVLASLDCVIPFLG